jgi:hypothetical protein
MGSRSLLVLGSVAALVALLLVSGCGSGGGAGGREITIQGPVTMARVFKEGSAFKYRFKVESQSGVKRTAYEQSVSTQSEFRTTSTVTSVKPDQVDLTMRFDYAVGGITMGDNMMPDEAAAALRGKDLNFVLDPDGRVRSWTGLSGEKALEAGAGEIAMLLYDVFPQLPDGPVSIGTTWTKPYEVPNITTTVERTFVGETTYTVTGFRQKFEINCVEIKTLSSFEFEGRAEQAGEAWLLSGDGVVEGTMLVSVDNGTIVYGASNATMNLTGEGASVASAAASGTVEVGTKSRLVIELM